MTEAEEKNKLLKEINNGLKSMVSRKETFIRGLISGVGTAIGATIIAGAIVGIIASVLSNYNIPFLNDIVPK